MKPRHQVSRAAIELIKRFEGYRRKAAQLPDGRWTIGHGHTLTARQGAEVSEDDAEALLLYDLITVAHVVNESTFTTLTQNQFDALCAFAFNVGTDNFRRSAVLKRVNEGAYIQAAFALELWRKADFEGERIVVDALVRRRAAEKILFLTPPGSAWTPAPSSLLKPVLDLDGADHAPRLPPTEVAPSFVGEQVVAHVEGRAVGEPSPAADPIRAAAAEITARLQTIFPDGSDAAAPERPPETPAAAPDDLPVSEAPSAELIADLISDADPFALEAEPSVAAEAGESETAAGDGAMVELAGPDLFEPPPPANDLPPEDPDAAPVVDPLAEGGPVQRVIIDDTAPFEFKPAPVQPLEQPRDSLFALMFLAILGLAFFGGGIFWALNARPGPQPGPLTPLMVGWLAGVAGVGFFVVAVFLLLQRLGRASERRGDNPRI